jgi:hypothetical protein
MEQRANLTKEYLQGSLTIMRKSVKRRYIKISNEFLRRFDLSFRARGLNAYILSRQDNWKVILSHVSNKHNKGKCYVSSAKKELVEAGFWHCIRLRNDSGEYEKGVTLVFDESRESIDKKDFAGDQRIFRTESDSNYTLLTCDHLDDPRLSLEAKGILSYILTKRNNWKIDVNHIQNMGTESIGIIRREINELIKYGYIQRFRVFKDGKLSEWQMVASEDPFNKSERIKSVLYFNNKIKINYEDGRSEIQIITNENDVNVEKVDDSDDIKTSDKESEKPSESKQSCAFNKLHENLLVVNIDKVNPDLSTIKNKLNITKKSNLSLFKNDMRDDFIYFSKEDIKKQIETHILAYSFEDEYIESVVDAIYKVLNSNREYIKISNVYYEADRVKSVFKALNYLDVEFFLDTFLKSEKEVKCLSSYIKTALYNNRINNDLYFKNKVNANEGVYDEDLDEDEFGDFEIEDDVDIFSSYSEFLEDVKADELSGLNEFDDIKPTKDNLKEKIVSEANKDDLSEEIDEATSYWNKYKKNLSSGKMLFLDIFVKEVEVVNGELCIHPKNSYKDKVKYELERKYLKDIKEFFKENYRIKECYIR